MRGQRILDPTAPAQVPSGLCALGIMTKAPEAGKVKTRLTPPLTAKEAAELNQCFLRDMGCSIASACREAPGNGVAIYTPLGEESAYAKLLPAEFVLLPQRGAAFGDRLILAAEDLFAVGFESVCLINSDSPTVPASSFAEAARELANPGNRIVLGPSEDGGYYLIGVKHLRSRLFEEIDWSTERVLTQTRERASELKIEVHELPMGFDVDDRETLRRLCQELLGDTPSIVAPCTQRFLRNIVDHEGRERIWPT